MSNWQRLSNPMRDEFVVVMLDNHRFGSGPGTVLEVTDDPVSDVIARYPERSRRLRIWRAGSPRATEGVVAGQRFSGSSLHGGTGLLGRLKP